MHIRIIQLIVVVAGVVGVAGASVSAARARARTSALAEGPAARSGSSAGARSKGAPSTPALNKLKGILVVVALRDGRQYRGRLSTVATQAVTLARPGRVAQVLSRAHIATVRRLTAVETSRLTVRHRPPSRALVPDPSQADRKARRTVIIFLVCAGIAALVGIAIGASVSYAKGLNKGVGEIHIPPMY